MVSLPDMRRDARAAFDAAVAAVQPGNLVPRRVRLAHGRLLVGGEAWPEVRGRRVVMAIGKAAPGLAGAWFDAAPGWAHEIFVLTPHGVPVPRAVEDEATILRGAHPYPDADGEASTRRLLEVAESLGADDLLVVLLSGGGSALMAAPAPGLELPDVRATTEALLKAGAAITEVNAVRRQLLAAAGGGLGRAAAPAAVRTLVLSDVLGDPLPDIASGPTVASASTAAEALAVLDRFAIRDAVPEAVERFLDRAAGQGGDDDAWASSSSTRVIGNNRTAVEAAAATLEERGWAVAIAPQHLVGEAAERGRELASEARARKPRGPESVVHGGETTVTVRGEGRGGRNQELALAAAIELEGAPHTVLLAAGTDGVDGRSDNAGAIVDQTTMARLRAAGIDVRAALQNNDSGTALETTGDAFRTGPTGTNVCDLTLVLTAPNHE